MDANITMSRADVVAAIKSDPYFALHFALDNNFPAIKQRMAEKGVAVSTVVEARDKILDFVRQGNADFVRYFFDVPYLDDNSNGTGGYRDFFVQNSPAPPNPAVSGSRTTSIWSGLLAFVGGGLAGLGGSLGGTGSGTSADAAAAAAAAKAAADKQKRTMWTVIAVIVGVIVLGVIAYFAFFRKKKGA